MLLTVGSWIWLQAFAIRMSFAPFIINRGKATVSTIPLTKFVVVGWIAVFAISNVVWTKMKVDLVKTHQYNAVLNSITYKALQPIRQLEEQ